MVEPAEGDAVVVPGLAFDATGSRLGRGRGYYDRRFPVGSQGAPCLVGFGYDFQVVERVPVDESDRRLDAIVTELGILWVRGTESSRR